MEIGFDAIILIEIFIKFPSFWFINFLRVYCYMKVIVSGKHVDLGNALSDYSKKNTKFRVAKYFPQATSAQVLYSKKGPFFHVVISVHEGTGKKIHLKGDGEDQDPYHAFDVALVKIEKQLLKHKKRMSKVRKGLWHRAKQYFIPEKNIDLLEKDWTTREKDNAEKTKKVESVQDAPTIVASGKISIPKTTVANAVFVMESEKLKNYLFINAGDDKINLVYYRDDGNIAWIETDFGLTKQK